MAKLWTKNGESSILVNASGLPYLCDDCPCEEPCDEQCDYRIKGYTDGDLANCSSCDDSEARAWPGVFKFHNGAYRASWYVDNCPDISAFSVSGKLLSDVQTSLWHSAEQRLYLSISCHQSSPGVNHVIWRGEKTAAGGRAGVYTRTSGCDTTSSLEIEACP
jgi:hypothetical protein